MFDEATSSLDAVTEKAITAELDILMKGKTVVYCAHRLSSIINVDTINVLKDGRVVEAGSHAELMAKPGSEYKEMWKNYLRGDNEEDEKKQKKGNEQPTLPQPALA